VSTNAPHVVEEVIRRLAKRYGTPSPFGKSRLYAFGDALSCSINYSKRLRGEKYFFGLAREVVDPTSKYPRTQLGDFVARVRGAADKTLMLPRSLVISALRKVATRKLDVFSEAGMFVLQTTGHPKMNVTEFLNTFPVAKRINEIPVDTAPPDRSEDRAHVRAQSNLIALGRAEGCSVFIVDCSDSTIWYSRNPTTKSPCSSLPPRLGGQRFSTN
jgi:hypothetical protein